MGEREVEGEDRVIATSQTFKVVIMMKPVMMILTVMMVMTMIITICEG